MLNIIVDTVSIFREALSHLLNFIISENCYKTKQLMDKSGIDSTDHVTSDAMELANQR